MKTMSTGGQTSISNENTQPNGPAGHVSVLYQPVIDYLVCKADGKYLDGTIGAGGHAEGILKALTNNGRLLGFDRDPEAIATAERRLSRFGDRVTLVHASYAQMDAMAPALGFSQVNGILLDLGLSSKQLDNPVRGFAFKHEGPLDMRFDLADEETAADLVNNLAEDELADIIYRYGEEVQSRRIARAIVASRPIHTTGDLARVVLEAMDRRKERRSVHPATQTFQALRIAVNRELEALQIVLPRAVSLLERGGRLAIISFHSLEDRMVKRFFRQESRDCLCPPELVVCACGHRATLRILTKKPIRPTADEVHQNPRSRSAKLRVAEKV